jgi:hypothetical protein
VVVYAVLVFALLPVLIPRLTDWETSATYTEANRIVVTETTRSAAPSDVAKREAAIKSWDEAQAAGTAEGARPAGLKIGDPITEARQTGGKPIYWSGQFVPVDEKTPLQIEVVEQRAIANGTVTVKQYVGPRKATGNFRLDFLIYELFGMDLTTKTNATLDTLTLPPKIIMPFLVMVVVSLLTRKNSKETLDRYYAKMKTPVDPNREADRIKLEAALADPSTTERVKLFPKSSWEFQKPNVVDVAGFVISFAICFLIIGLAAWVAGIGG